MTMNDARSLFIIFLCAAGFIAGWGQLIYLFHSKTPLRLHLDKRELRLGAIIIAAVKLGTPGSPRVRRLRFGGIIPAIQAVSGLSGKKEWL
jgi:hypothetical protein